MLRNWSIIKMSSLMAMALAAAPSPAAEQADMKDLKDSISSLSKKLDASNGQLLKALDDILAELKKSNNLETALKVATMQGVVDSLEKQMATMRADLERLQGRDKSSYPNDKPGMEDLTSRLNKIEEALARLSGPRIANAPPPNLGRIQLVNMYPEDMLFVVNGAGYRVAPYSTRILDNQPAGTFSYEVISGMYGLRASNRPLLEAGKTYTITVR